MYINCTIDTIILAQAVIQLFCWQYCFAIQNAKSEKGEKSVKYLQKFAKC